MLESQNIKTFLLKDTLQTGQTKILLSVKLKIKFLRLMLLVTWIVKKFFYEKELQKTSQEKSRIEKVLKRKGDKLYVNGKDMIIFLIVGLIKKISYVSKRH